MPRPVRKVAKSFKSMFKKKNLPFSMQSGLEGTLIRGALGLTTKARIGVKQGLTTKPSRSVGKAARSVGKRLTAKPLRITTKAAKSVGKATRSVGKARKLKTYSKRKPIR